MSTQAPTPGLPERASERGSTPSTACRVLEPRIQPVVRCESESLSNVPFFATPWTAAHQAPLCREFSRQEYWSGFAVSFSRGSSPPRGQTLVSHIAGRAFTNWASREATSQKSVTSARSLRASLSSRKMRILGRSNSWPRHDTRSESPVTLGNLWSGRARKAGSCVLRSKPLPALLVTRRAEPPPARGSWSHKPRGVTRQPPMARPLPEGQDKRWGWRGDVAAVRRRKGQRGEGSVVWMTVLRPPGARKADLPNVGGVRVLVFLCLVHYLLQLGMCSVIFSPRSITLGENLTATVYIDDTFIIAHDFGMLWKQPGFLPSNKYNFKQLLCSPIIRCNTLSLSLQLLWWLWGILNLTLWEWREITLLTFLQGTKGQQLPDLRHGPKGYFSKWKQKNWLEKLNNWPQKINK